jgi:hypothetical protein
MKPAFVIAGMLLATTVVASPRAAQIAIPLPAVDVLTAIDSVPEREQVQRALGSDAEAELQRISLASLDTVDAGVQVRAVRALAHFDNGHATLLAVLARDDIARGRNGTSVVVQRTALDALATFGKTTDVSLFVDYLNADYNRDVRATAARALGDLGDPSAIEPLRTRFSKEPSPQVKFEISDSLHKLGQ